MTQWDDPQNQETRAYPRQSPSPGPGHRQDQPGYGQEQRGYGQEQPGWDQPQPAGQRPDEAHRRRFEDSTSNPFGAASNQAFGIVNTVLSLLGLVLGLVTLTGLEWFSTNGGMSFGETDTFVQNSPDPTGFASAYFGWLAWVFLIVAVVAGVASSFPSPALRAFRVIGVVVGFAAAGLSFLAVQLTQSGYLQYLQDARVGFYLTVIAYLLVGIGSALGPRKV